MSRKKISAGNREDGQRKHVTLKMLADYVGFAPATVSLVMNQSAVADGIPQRTKDLIFAAAEKLRYHPNFVARSLRTQRTFSVGVIVPEISEGYETQVLSGIEDYLLQAGYFYFVVSHRHKTDLIEEYPKLLLGRSVDGIIAVDTPWKEPLRVPVVTVSGHYEVKGVTNVEVDHDMAAELALRHLYELGHRRLAFIKGQEFSSDTELRWNAIVRSAQRLGLTVSRKLVRQLVGDIPSPELGYNVARKLIAARESFTALFAFNDISAIGAIQALRESGLQVPGDVSVVGFDDIPSAAFQSPGLTTVRQPLRKMGKIAAETLLRRITSSKPDAKPTRIVVEPELAARGTTGPAPAQRKGQSKEPRHTQHPKRAGSSCGAAAATQDGMVEILVRRSGLSKDKARTVADELARYLNSEPAWRRHR